jgi:hypothetical protein
MHDGKLCELEEWFTDYCRTFENDDESAVRNYTLKELHTAKVRANIRLLAEAAGLSGDRLDLAEMVGLLHDVGRFEQYRNYRTFQDSKSENHAALSVKVIRDNRLLEGLTKEEAAIILQAVGLHNAFKIPASVTGEQRLFLNLIRDADKLDIWRVFVDQSSLPDNEQASAANLDFPDLPDCSPEVLETIGRRQMVELSLLRTVNDFRLLQLSWVFDLHFPDSFRLARERGDLARLAAKLPYSPSVERSLRTVWDVLSSRCC